MFKRLRKSYIDSFRGLPKAIWWLALITLINRAGTMVIPFLSLYLEKSKGFDLEKIGWVMSAFGLGSVIGSYLGGWISDKIGPYKTMLLSLGSSAISYIMMQYASSFYSIAGMVFITILLADIFRPAMFASLRNHTDDKTQTRATSLIRLAINLGFSAGPAIGGFLIYNFGYSALFWVDGVTCFLAMLLMMQVLSPRKSKPQETYLPKNPVSAYKNKTYLFFILGMILFAFAFLQYFSTVPLYYSKSYDLSEQTIGLLMGFNGLLVFLIEMPVVTYLEKKGKGALHFVFSGALLLLLSFACLQLNHAVGWLWIGMALMSVAEVIAFPFANSFALQASKMGNPGQYMGLFSISFSIAHILGHNTGLQLINNFGFTFTWWTVIIICAAMAIIFFRLRKFRLG